ncbi:RodZ domain-containing protein [Cognatilysobacter tabacisoli]|uniref:RodZ domain-containing protein n=1 Tax=Cognatilysobacter tabacisoli TaxID=2315424 RepID=UPI000E6AED9A|nr:RodZ domain-containing protein [Lysobacter tabacisoli]
MIESNQSATEFGGRCGARLREAREAAGLSIESVAAQLKMPARVVRSLESDDWSTLGAPVFVRGQVRSYARLLGVDVDPLLEQASIATVRASNLVSHNHTPTYRRVAEQFTRRAVYVVMTAAIAVPVWFGATYKLREPSAVESLELEPSAGEVATPAVVAAPPVRERTPVVASIASLPAKPAAALTLSLTGDSWVQVFSADGRELEQGLLTAGQSRSYAAGEVGRVVIGNSASVQVLNAGRAVDLAPFSRANVARFTLSSDGSLTPVVQ